MEGVGEGVRYSHLPGVHQQDAHSLEHGPEHLVQLQGVPVAVVQAHLLVQGLEVGRADHHERPRRPVQKSHQREPNVAQPAYVHLHGEGAEMGPDAEDHDGVGTPREAVQLVGDVPQLAGRDGGEADGRAVAAVFQEDVVRVVHRHERPDVFRTVQVELLQPWGERNTQRVKWGGGDSQGLKKREKTTLTWDESNEVLKPLSGGGVSVKVDHLVLQTLNDGRWFIELAHCVAP